MMRGASAPRGRATAAFPPGPDAAGGATPADAFFERLPMDELSSDELELRQALLGRLEREPESTLLADISKDPGVSTARATLLPAEVPLRIWIDRRVGGEIEVNRDDKSRFVLKLRGKPSPEDDQGGEAEREPAEDGLGLVEQKEAWFDSLPPDGFTPGEEQLREAVISFLGKWRDRDPPSLSDLGGSEGVKRARAAAFKNVNVKIKEWIERRIAGEVEIIKDATDQWRVGFVGRMNHAAVSSLNKPMKRKYDEPGKGKEPKGKSKGKPSRVSGDGPRKRSRH